MKYLKKYEDDDFTYNDKKFIRICFNNFSEKISDTNPLVKRYKFMKDSGLYFINYLGINEELGNGSTIVALVGEIGKFLPSYFIMKNKSSKITTVRHWNVQDNTMNRIYKVLYNKYVNYEFQKEFLENNPLEYKKIEEIGFAPGIEDEFSYLWDADEMGLL